MLISERSEEGRLKRRARARHRGSGEGKKKNEKLISPSKEVESREGGLGNHAEKSRRKTLAGRVYYSSPKLAEERENKRSNLSSALRRES